MRLILIAMLVVCVALAVMAADPNTAAERTERTTVQEAQRTERTIAQETQRTERTAIQESNQTERQYISAQSLMWLATEREATLRLIVLLLVVVVASAGAVTVTVLILRATPRRPGVPADVAWMERQLPGHRAEFDSIHGWILVDADNRFYAIRDAARLLSADRLGR